MTSAALLAAVLSAGAIGVEASWVVTEDHSYSSWCGEQPGYPHLGSTLFSQGLLIPSDSVEWGGIGYVSVDGHHWFGGVSYAPSWGGYYVSTGPVYSYDGSVLFDGNTDPADNPRADSCNYVIEQTSFVELLPGDSTRDGLFDSSDLIAVFRAGQYEDSTSSNSTWDTGDWNADLDFTSGDLVVALQTGAYGAASASPVPEPTSLLFMALMFAYVLRYLLTT